MNNFLKVSLVAGIATALTACSHGLLNSHTKDYQQQAKSVSPLVSTPTAQLRHGRDFYPVPAGKSTAPVKQPSLVPPGSNLSRFANGKKVAAKKTAITVAKWSEINNSEPVLMLSEKEKEAWTRVGRALRASNYQVLDQDPSMSSFYVLDSSVTKNHITDKTPIYRVYLKEQKDGSTQVELLNEKNQPVTTAVARRVLGSVQQHLT